MRGTVGTQLSIHERLARDLPDMWDWEPVQWGKWTSTLHRSSLAFHLPLDALACDKCGTLGETLVCFGKRPARRDLGETVPTKNLWAYRYADCGHDAIHDKRTNEHWDLDDTDYGIAGSVRPEHAHTTDLTEQPEPTTLF